MGVARSGSRLEAGDSCGQVAPGEGDLRSGLLGAAGKPELLSPAVAVGASDASRPSQAGGWGMGCAGWGWERVCVESLPSSWLKGGGRPPWEGSKGP